MLFVHTFLLSSFNLFSMLLYLLIGTGRFEKKERTKLYTATRAKTKNIDHIFARRLWHSLARSPSLSPSLLSFVA
jgi:hypothetical protein